MSKVDWINLHSCCLGAFTFQRKQADAYAGGQHVSLVLGARGSSVDDDETGGGAPGLERHVVSYFTTLVNAQFPCFYFVLSPPPCTEHSTAQVAKVSLSSSSSIHARQLDVTQAYRINNLCHKLAK